MTRAVTGSRFVCAKCDSELFPRQRDRQGFDLKPTVCYVCRGRKIVTTLPLGAKN